MRRKTPTRRRAQAPATKQDIALLMDSIGKHYDATERWKNEMLAWKEEILRHFDVKCEELTHNFQGALTDKISVHDVHLKRHDGEIHTIRMHVGMR